MSLSPSQLLTFGDKVRQNLSGLDNILQQINRHGAATEHRGPDLQRGAVFRERGAEEGVDGVKDHVDDVFLQDGIRKTLLSFITNLQKKKQKGVPLSVLCVCA